MNISEETWGDPSLFCYAFKNKAGELMTKKQQRFADEYIIDLNATQAAIRAGYSRSSAKQAGQRILTYDDVRKYIQGQLDKLHSSKVADAQEVMEHLTSVMRGETTEEVVVVEGCGEGVSEAKILNKGVGERDKLKAAELLGKRFGLFKERVDLDMTATVTIIDDLDG